MPAEIAAKVVVYGATLFLVGAAVARWMLLPQVEANRSATLGLRWMCLAAWSALAVGLALRAWAHTAAVFGMTDSVSSAALKTIVIDSRWGEAWRWQAAIAAAGLAAAIAASRSRASQIVGGLATVALPAALARSGHAAGSPLRLALHTAHIFAGGAWLGTLATIAIVGREKGERARLLRAFSPIAIAGAAALGVTGAWAALEYIGALANLATTAYGRVLTIKLVLVMGAAGCGLVNWRSLRLRSTTRVAPALRWELGVAAAIVVATAVLTELAHP